MQIKENKYIQLGILNYIFFKQGSSKNYHHTPIIKSEDAITYFSCFSHICTIIDVFSSCKLSNLGIFD